MQEKLNESLNYIQSKTTIKPEVGIILGTGLGGLTKEIQSPEIVEYADIPNFPVSTVESHKGKLLFGSIEGKRVVVMQGRFHYYEGYSMQQVTFPVRILKMLGIKQLLISNAAGGLDEAHDKGDLMVIQDHINLQPENPLRGQNLDSFGPRFPDMSEPYDLNLIRQAESIAKEKDIRLHQGVYVAVSGPNLETRAEYKFLSLIGANAVGMSTVPENIVARQMDLPCFAVSVITDLCTPSKIQKVTVEEVIAAAHLAEPKLTLLMKEMIKRL